MKLFLPLLYLRLILLSAVSSVVVLPAMAGEGYLPTDNSVAFITDGQGKPALIPMPRSLSWTSERFFLNSCHLIRLNSKVLLKEASLVKNEFAKLGIKTIIETSINKKEQVMVELQLLQSKDETGEAYSIQVKQNTVLLQASTLHGMFNAVQTLRQLMTGQQFIPGCMIKDAPALPWRGYMADVSRNFQSIQVLKQLINVMASYKLNVFHIHLTDNPAWRLQIKKYPQLTDSAYMTRDKGKYYTVQDMQDLIRYCKERYITLVPELDMPGHSKAFTDAMGTDMQSPEGLEIVKNIVREICTTYDLPYFHMGADEVKIHNTQFLPEVTALAEQLGKKVIGWKPGGHFDGTVIRQLWQDDVKGKAEELNNDSLRFIDSYHLYLNHMDPLNSVVSIFNRKLGNDYAALPGMLGGEICMWTDRKVAQENDVFLQNPVYPALVTFAERSWKGGGSPGILVNMGADSSERSVSFREFETRLIEHKRKYFSQLPFPYVQQGHIQWKLFGPFPNQGELSASFWPEQNNVSLPDSAAGLYARGATIWLRHFFNLKGWVEHPEENMTWYGYTRFWSNKDTTMNFWAGTRDISRSHPDDTPPEGGWDYLQTKMWINGQLIEPPHWQRAGEKGGWDIPLVDEGFTYRNPLKLPVQKGWNQLLVKAPAGSFKQKAWYLPVKWMFTIVPVHQEKGANWYANDLLFAPDNKHASGK